MKKLNFWEALFSVLMVLNEQVLILMTDCGK